MSKFNSFRAYKTESSDGIEAEVIVKYYAALSEPEEIIIGLAEHLVSDKKLRERSEALEHLQMLSDAEN